MKRLLLIVTLSAFVAGCAGPNHQKWVRSEVFFGLSRPDGSQISIAEWQAFLDQQITPYFPAGLSVVDIAGQWRNEAGHIDREPSKVLVLLYPSDRSTEAKLDAIRAEYCRRFKQEAVMKVTTEARVAF